MTIHKSASAAAFGTVTKEKPRRLSENFQPDVHFSTTPSKKKRRQRRSATKKKNTSTSTSGSIPQNTLGDYSSSDDDDSYTEHEMARLLSLNESQGDETEEVEGVAVRGDSGDGKNIDPNKAHSKTRLEPVGVFWDIENCPVPVEKSAFKLAAKIRRVFFTGKREAEFLTVLDIRKERQEVIDSLHKAQVRFCTVYFVY